MAISIFDLFKIGIGPSSSHTVGPMVAANQFIDGLTTQGNLGAVDSISVDLYGSLGATGKGHGSGKAVLLGLMGEKPDLVDVESVQATMQDILDTKKINLAGSKIINFNYDEDITFHRKKSLPFHANGMMITACDASEDIYTIKFIILLAVVSSLMTANVIKLLHLLSKTIPFYLILLLQATNY